MSSHDFKLPKLCPKCKKETEREKLTFAESMDLQKSFVEKGLVPPGGLLGIACITAMASMRKCRVCNHIIDLKKF